MSTTQSEELQPIDATQFAKGMLSWDLLPTTKTEAKIYRDIRSSFGSSPFIFSLYQFYISTLGVNAYNSVLYNSLDNPIHFSYSDTNKNNYQTLAIGDKVFKKDSIDPNDNKRFSHFYCDMINRLHYESDFHLQDKHERIIDNLLLEIEKYEEKLKTHSLTETKRKFLVKRREKLKKQIERVQSSDVFSALSNMKDVCEIVQCSDNNNCADYDEDKRAPFLMKTKDFNSQHINHEPKVTLGINIDSLYSVTESSYRDIITKIKKGEIDPEKIAQQLDYFQAYDANQFFGHTTQIQGKVVVAFEKVIKASVKFGDWFNPNIYYITADRDMTRKGFDYSIYTQYCRRPEKIIIGVKPVIIYSKTVKDLKQANLRNQQYRQQNQQQNSPDVFVKADNIISESEQYHVISKDEKNSVVILGYEVNSDLCDSPLIRSFKNIQEVKGEPRQTTTFIPPGVPFGLILKRFYDEILKLDMSTMLSFSSLDNLINFSNFDIENNYQITKFSDRVFDWESNMPQTNQKFSDLYCQTVQILAKAYHCDDKNEAQRNKLINQIKALEVKIKDHSIGRAVRERYKRKKIELETQLSKFKICDHKTTINNALDMCNVINLSQNGNSRSVNPSKMDNFLMKVKNPNSPRIYYTAKSYFEANIGDLLKIYSNPVIQPSDIREESTNSGGGFFNKVFNNIINFFNGDSKTNKKPNYNIDQDTKPDSNHNLNPNPNLNLNLNAKTDSNIMKEPSDYFQSYDVVFSEGDGQKTGKVIVYFEKILRLPIKFPWFDPNIYQVSVDETLLNKEQDYSIYTKFCRIPKKIMIGIKPQIIYTPPSNEPDQTQTQETESKEQYHTIPEDSIVVLGYEINDNLCKSTVIGAFEYYNQNLKTEL